MTLAARIGATLILLAAMESGSVVAMQEPKFAEQILDPATKQLVYILSSRQQYKVMVPVDSECNWLNIVSGGTPSEVPKGRTWVEVASVSASSAMKTVTLTHTVSGQISGATSYTCEPVTTTYQPPKIRWVDMPPNGETQLNPYAPFVLKMTEKTDVKSPFYNLFRTRPEDINFFAPGGTRPASGDNRTPTGTKGTAPTTETIGLDFPDLPLPDTGGKPLTHEEVFGDPVPSTTGTKPVEPKPVEPKPVEPKLVLPTMKTKNVADITETLVDAVPEGGGCSDTTDCLPLDSCTSGTCGDLPTPGDGWDQGFQEIGAETLRVRIEITPQQASLPARRDANPLGLLSRSISEFVDWWMPTVYAAEQSLQKGLQFLITSQGGSTGKNLTMQVLNFTGKPVNLQGMLALEPMKKDAQQKVTQAFSKLAGRQLPSKVDLNAYCLEFLKLPPMAGQIMRVAGPEVQKRFAPMKRIMAAANKLTAGGALKPDSNPASYADSVKQWALWTVEQKFTDQKFAEAFLGHTKKNVEAAGQKWTKQIEDVVRQRTPNRWQDIVQILKTAGAPVPQ